MHFIYVDVYILTHLNKHCKTHLQEYIYFLVQIDLKLIYEEKQ